MRLCKTFVLAPSIRWSPGVTCLRGFMRLRSVCPNNNSCRGLPWVSEVRSRPLHHSCVPRGHKRYNLTKISRVVPLLVRFAPVRSVHSGRRHSCGPSVRPVRSCPLGPFGASPGVTTKFFNLTCLRVHPVFVQFVHVSYHRRRVDLCSRLGSA